MKMSAKCLVYTNVPVNETSIHEIFLKRILVFVYFRQETNQGQVDNAEGKFI